MSGPAHAPDVPRPAVDAHHHLWDPARRDHPWMARPGLEPLRRRFDLADLRAAVRGTPVVRTVLVQAVGEEAETHELLATASGSAGLVAGVVGWVDLAAPDVVDRLAALRARPGGHLLVGVRHQVEDEDRDWLRRPAVLRGARAVADAGLVHDLLVRPDQLPSAVALADALPGARLVLDHGAKPPVGTTGWDAWAAGVATLARREQVVCKVSGLLTQLPPGAPPEALAPSVDHLLALFGPDRLLAGSDWPVSTLVGGYARTWALTTGWASALSPGERDAVVRGTATRTYSLGVPPDAGPPAGPSVDPR